MPEHGDQEVSPVIIIYAYIIFIMEWNQWEAGIENCLTPWKTSISLTDCLQPLTLESGV